MTFALSKWYLDVVSRGGRVAIAYWGDVRYGPLRQVYSGLFSRPGTGRFRFSRRKVAPPSLEGGVLRWEVPALGLRVTGMAARDGFSRTLLDTPEGTIVWRCKVPTAEVCFEIDSEPIQGKGYVELLEMSILPWKIPADTIRWGRFHGGDTAVVWIDWRGEAPQCLVYVDGCLVRDADIGDDRVRIDGGFELELDRGTVLEDETLGQMLAPLAVLQRLSSPIARTRYVRWLSQAVFTGSDAEPVEGHAIHELLVRG